MSTEITVMCCSSTVTLLQMLTGCVAPDTLGSNLHATYFFTNLGEKGILNY